MCLKSLTDVLITNQNNAFIGVDNIINQLYHLIQCGYIIMMTTYNKDPQTIEVVACLHAKTLLENNHSIYLTLHEVDEAIKIIIMGYAHIVVNTIQKEVM